MDTKMDGLCAHNEGGGKGIRPLRGCVDIPQGQVGQRGRGMSTNKNGASNADTFSSGENALYPASRAQIFHPDLLVSMTRLACILEDWICKNHSNYINLHLKPTDCRVSAFQMSGKITDLCRWLPAGAALIQIVPMLPEDHLYTTSQTRKVFVLASLGASDYIHRSL